MLIAAFMACTADTIDSAATETGISDTGAGDTGTDTETDSDTGADTGLDPVETGDTAVPYEYSFVAGPTGAQIDMNYVGAVSAADVVRYGFWTSPDMAGVPVVYGETAATFPTSVVAELEVGDWYVGAFLDFGGDNSSGPGEGDASSRWQESNGMARSIPVQAGLTTVGTALTFTLPE